MILSTECFLSLLVSSHSSTGLSPGFVSYFSNGLILRSYFNYGLGQALLQIAFMCVEDGGKRRNQRKLK